MYLIVLDMVESTNDFLKNYVRSFPYANNYTSVVAHKQTKGRGQQKSIWESEPYKNLTASIYLNKKIKAKSSFQINMLISNSIYDALEYLKIDISYLSVKWPNDIYYKNKKLCGILVDTIGKGKFINDWIIGIGLNVNQTSFGTLKAISLKNIIGKDSEVKEILKCIRSFLIVNVKKDLNLLKKKYVNRLYKKEKVHCFSDKNNIRFNGIIKGISNLGELQVFLENDEIKKFEIKEIKF